MQTVIDVIYENGVFKPLVPLDVQEHRHYRLILQPTVPRPAFSDLVTDPALAAEIERRTTVLPDGRKLVQVAGLFSADMSNVPDDKDPVREALDELRRERAQHFDEQWPEPKTTEG